MPVQYDPTEVTGEERRRLDVENEQLRVAEEAIRAKCRSPLLEGMRRFLSSETMPNDR